MDKDYECLINEIKNVREQLYCYIEKNGIDDDISFIRINHKMDELILEWIRRKSD